MIAAGGFGRYERNHLDALAATFAPHTVDRSPTSRRTAERSAVVAPSGRRAFHAAYLPPPTKQATSHYQVAPLRALLERGERVGDLGRRDAPAERGEDHAAPAERGARAPRSGRRRRRRPARRARRGTDPQARRSYSRDAAASPPAAPRHSFVPSRSKTTAACSQPPHTSGGRSLVASRSAWNLRGHRI